MRPGELFRELEVIRRQGYAVPTEEARMGCAALPPSSTATAQPLAAISVSGMTSRVTVERVPDSENVREVAAELTVALGGVMPAAKPLT